MPFYNLVIVLRKQAKFPCLVYPKTLLPFPTTFGKTEQLNGCVTVLVSSMIPIGTQLYGSMYMYSGHFSSKFRNISTLFEKN